MHYALAGESFSSAYDCSGKSDAIKTMVTSIAENGCCGPNGQSTCAAAPPTDTNQNKGNTTTGIESSATTALSNVFATICPLKTQVCISEKINFARGIWCIIYRQVKINIFFFCSW